jgi:LPXTG-motif cell wall-anchored protein
VLSNSTPSGSYTSRAAAELELRGGSRYCSGLKSCVRHLAWLLPWIPSMDTNTLLLIIVVILLLGGGGFFFRRR